MLSILLVDDEAIVRKGIRTSIDWQQYDVQIIGEASNGEEALEKIQLLRPDIVITDIRMPLMDGLELSKKLKDMDPAACIIILSGYEEFEYAKQAIKIGVNEYILKPVTEEELITSVLKLKNELAAEAAKKESNIQSHLLLNKNLLQIRGKFVGRLIDGDFSNQNEVMKEAERLKIDLKGPRFCVITVESDGVDTNSAGKSVKDRELERYTVYNVVEESFLQKASGVFVYGRTVFLVGIVNLEHVYHISITDLCRHIQSNVKSYLNIPLSFGIGKVCNSMAQISTSFYEAEQALKNRFYDGQSSIMVCESVNEATKKNIIFYTVKDEKAIAKSINDMDETAFADIMGRIFTKFYDNRPEETDVKEVCCRIVNEMFRAAEEMNLNANAFLGEEMRLYRKINQYKFIADIKACLYEMFHKVAEGIQGTKSRKYVSIVRNAIKYMEENYGKDIALSELACHSAVSPNYFSMVFKDETGVNFVDWLNRLRIDKAMHLLKETNMKIYQVAGEVGYSDYKYFSSIFKKLTGKSPKEYKNSY